ncbi:hypothetical protein [Haloprofundus salilacus]|uniref:hypothetical protein n=1 Tax=Haloprofundus salilacus TaxID=2876190 RepID=UPI001CCA087A|nr:hypothetical protein [Haloprofundus salilacus]
MTRDPLDGFDADLVSSVAADHETTPERLSELVARHQRSVRDLPGVDDIVYEWRKAFAENPVVERQTERYLLSVPSHVWPEFASALSLSDTELAALQAVHAAQMRVDVGEDTDVNNVRDDGDDREIAGNDDGGDDPMILVRP